MPYIDRFLELLASNNASALLLVGDDVARLEIGGSPRPITKQPLTTAQLLTVIREIAPAEASRELDAGRGAAFRYGSASGECRVHVVRDGEKLRIEITPASATAAASATPAPVVTSGAASNDGARESMERLLRML